MRITALATPPTHATWAVVAHPLGELLAALTAEGQLCRTTFLHNGAPAEILHQWQQEWPATTFRPGKIAKTYARLPLVMVGTTLQQQICEEILTVKKGEVATYGDIANRINLPGRARAVGRACRECCLTPIIPCHRIIGAAGIGGYGTQGVELKQKLLAAEGTHIALGTRGKWA